MLVALTNDGLEFFALLGLVDRWKVSDHAGADTRLGALRILFGQTQFALIAFGTKARLTVVEAGTLLVDGELFDVDVLSTAEFLAFFEDEQVSVFYFAAVDGGKFLVGRSACLPLAEEKRFRSFHFLNYHNKLI